MHSDRERVELDARRRQPVVKEQQRDQERHASHQRHVGGDRPGEQAMAGEASHARHGPDRRADQDRNERELGREQRAPRERREGLQEQRKLKVHWPPLRCWTDMAVERQRRCHSHRRKSCALFPGRPPELIAPAPAAYSGRQCGTQSAAGARAAIRLSRDQSPRSSCVAVVRAISTPFLMTCRRGGCRRNASRSLP